MPTTSLQHINLQRRRNRTRAQLARHTETPRLTVYRSLRHIFAQIIDDKAGKTLVSSYDHTLNASTSKTDAARQVGTELAEKAKALGITAVRFDRGSYKYHGRVAALAEAARVSGLTF